jgi:hypothetical protein
LTDKKHILKSASIISLVTIVSRILGYVREQRIALHDDVRRGRDFTKNGGAKRPRSDRQIDDGLVHPDLQPPERESEKGGDREPAVWTLALVVAVLLFWGWFSPQVVHLFAD